MNHVENSIHFVRNILVDAWAPLLALVLGMVPGLLYAAKRAYWWMFPISIAITGIGIFFWEMTAFGLDNLNPTISQKVVGTAGLYVMPTLTIGLVTRSGWVKATVAGLISVVVMIIAAIGLNLVAR
jgi:hypothetical protein